jgi:outer membrane protein assembly factor BamE
MIRIHALRLSATRATRLALLALLLAGLAACSLKPYRIDIQQGNVVSHEQVAQLKPGMTKEQVRFLLGTPLLVDIFHQQRWDFVYRYEKGGTREVEASRVAVLFAADNKVEKIEVEPASLAKAQEGKGLPAKSRVYDIGVPAAGQSTGVPQGDKDKEKPAREEVQP